MNAVMQEITDHAPDSGIYGDCYRAALATILDLPLSSVPHYMQIHHPDIDLALREYGKFLSSPQTIGLVRELTTQDLGSYPVSVAEGRSGGTSVAWQIGVFVKTFVAKQGINQEQ